MLPVDHTPLEERTTQSLREELAARERAIEEGQAGAHGLLNRSRIGMIRTELDRRRRERPPITIVVPADATVLERGLWCTGCAVPSAVRVAVTLRSDPTVRLADPLVCLDCGQVTL